MNRPEPISARPAQEIVPEKTPVKSFKKKDETVNLDQKEDFDELTIMAWSQIKFKPYAAEFFQIKAEDSETRDQLEAVDTWVRAELDVQGKEPTLYNFKQLMKQLNMEKGVRTLDDFLSKVLNAKEETISDQLGGKGAKVAEFLKSLIKIME